jgi:quinolinate synthase
MGDVIPTGAPRQGELPAAYREASEDELHAASARRSALGERVVVLGHFYQREEVVAHADYVGDSFQLANAALSSRRPRRSSSAACTSWPRPPTCSPAPTRR